MAIPVEKRWLERVFEFSEYLRTAKLNELDIKTKMNIAKISGFLSSAKTLIDIYDKIDEHNLLVDNEKAKP